MKCLKTGVVPLQGISHAVSLHGTARAAAPRFHDRSRRFMRRARADEERRRRARRTFVRLCVPRAVAL